jgi:hypothetical protein
MKHVVTDRYDESAHMEGHDVGVKGIIKIAYQLGKYIISVAKTLILFVSGIGAKSLGIYNALKRTRLEHHSLEHYSRRTYMINKVLWCINDAI